MRGRLGTHLSLYIAFHQLEGEVNTGIFHQDVLQSHNVRMTHDLGPQDKQERERATHGERDEESECGIEGISDDFISCVSLPGVL